MNRKIILTALILISYSFTSAQVNTLKEQIYFKIGKADLTFQHKKKLDSIVHVLKFSESFEVDIKGYTCSIGSLSINKVISKLRALNVYNYLVDKGLDREKMKYAGFSMENPLGDNKTAAGRSMNRRTDIDVVFKLLDENSESNTINNTNITENNQNSNTNNNTNITENNQNSNTNNNISSSSTLPKSGIITELGPNISTGEFENIGKKIITSTNCIKIEIPEYGFSTSNKDKFEFDFKDYSKNFDIIKKKILTKSGKNNLMLHSAFSLQFSQANDDITLDVNNPIKIYIPGDFDPEIKLYSNHRNWTLDTTNILSYDQSRKSYVVSVKLLGQMFGLLKPMPTTKKTIMFKIKGVESEKFVPYLIFDNCLITSGKYVKGKFYAFEVPNETTKFSLKSSYTDFSNSKPEHFSLSEEMSSLVTYSTKTKNINDTEYTLLKGIKFNFNNSQLAQSGLCETPCE